MSRFIANKDYCLCTKELVNKVDDMLYDKSIMRDKPCLLTLQRLSEAKQVNNFATTMLEDINNVLSQMIEDTRHPDLIRYNNIVEAAVFSSAMEAERQLRIYHNSIYRCLKGRQKTAGGFYWRYASTEQQNSKQ